MPTAYDGTNFYFTFGVSRTFHNSKGCFPIASAIFHRLYAFVGSSPHQHFASASFCCLLPRRRGLPIACDDGHLFRRNERMSEQSELCSDLLFRNSIDALTFRSASKAKPGAAVVIRKGGATERARDGVCFEKENAVADDRQSATTWCEYS